MSGGNFDYLYSRMEENPLNSETLRLLESMSEWLAEQNKPLASAELKRIHTELVEINQRIYELAQRQKLANLLKAAEWWCSHDTVEKDFDAEWKIYTNS